LRHFLPLSDPPPPAGGEVDAAYNFGVNPFQPRLF
jgi:hypothetical protein